MGKKISSNVKLARNVATGNTYTKGTKEIYMDRWRRKQKLIEDINK